MKNNQNQYDIFISYRRSGSFETANLIADRLKNAGYKVFFDVESLKSGKFNEQLYSVIEQCTDFIIVLPENGLDRCSDQNDWLRLEIMHALKNKKNIIPVILRGFTFPKTMPVGLEELEKYQSVTAVSNEYFDASIDRLKSYLKTKISNKWEGIKKSIYILAGIILLSFIIVGTIKIKDKRLLIRVCQSESILMAGEFAKMNIVLDQVNSIQSEWTKYYNSMKNADPRDTASIRKNFLTFVQSKKVKLMSETPGLELSEQSADILKEHGIKSEDIVAFYKNLNPLFFNQVNEHIEKLQLYAKRPFISEKIYQNTNMNIDFLKLLSKSLYLGYLALLSTMPDEVYDEAFYKTRKELHYFNDISVNKTNKEYVNDMEITMDEMEKIVAIKEMNTKEAEIENKNLNR